MLLGIMSSIFLFRGSYQKKEVERKQKKKL